MNGKRSVLLLLCGGLNRTEKGLDPDRLARGLEEREPDLKALVVPRLCERPESVSETAAEHRPWRLVLGVCSKAGFEVELFSEARKAKLDPFGIRVVALGTYCSGIEDRASAMEKAMLLLGASIARARAFSGTGQASVRASFLWDQKITRRSLFRLPPLRYEVVPSIDREACAVGEGCRVCAEICPRSALSVSEGGAMRLAKESCTACGACLTACPQRAIGMPGYSLEEIEAELSVLLSESPAGSRGGREILFLCERSLSGSEGSPCESLLQGSHRLPVEVPCLGMVSPGWIFHALARGASRVGLLPCGREDCRFGRRETIEGRVDYCRTAVALLEGCPDRIQLLDGPDGKSLDLEPVPINDRDATGGTPGSGSFLDRRSEGKALLDLSRKLGSPAAPALEHPYATLGDLRLKEGCTACGACAEACPTGALSLERGPQGVTLAFDAERCVACERCSPLCPEGVLEVKRGFHLKRLAEGRCVLYHTADVPCKRCGGPIAPASMLERIASLMGNDPALEAIRSICLDCRGALTSSFRR